MMPHIGPSPQFSSRKRKRSEPELVLGFTDRDKEGTTQPHHDALMVTLQIAGCDVRRVMINQGSGAEIMYPDLYQGLGLKLEDLSQYDMTLVGFDGKVVLLVGQIKLPIVAEGTEVLVNSMVVHAYSPYTAILA